jgi:hypothetical protein
MAKKTHAEMMVKVVKSLVKALLADGLKISVFDGEEYSVKRSTDLNAIIKGVFDFEEDGKTVQYMTTDFMKLKVRDANNETIGEVALIGCNSGWEVIADYHMSLEKYMGETDKLIEKLETEFYKNRK